MKNPIFIIIFIAAGIAIYDFLDLETDFVVPQAAAGKRTGSGIKQFEFTELFAQNQPFSGLARKGYYTVIEGYIDSCPICKHLEAEFTPFLRERHDVLIRRVHFPEEVTGQSFTGNSAQEVNRQIADYHERLGKYNFIHVDKTDSGYRIATCGTPHIEIYGPDKQLLASDKCAGKNTKTGLAFMKKWIESERS